MRHESGSLAGNPRKLGSPPPPAVQSKSSINMDQSISCSGSLVGITPAFASVAAATTRSATFAPNPRPLHSLPAPGPTPPPAAALAVAQPWPALARSSSFFHLLNVPNATTAP
ncbi:hypothetical protein CCHL11_00512, partial [Colletotrichum chlorophyti]